MSFSLDTLVFSLLALTALAGAVTTVLTKDVLRLAMGLGAFLLAVAGYFLYFMAPFLAVAQVFVYVGGVLVLMLFAIMLTHRALEGQPALESRHDVASAAVAGALFYLVVSTLRNTPSLTTVKVEPGSTQDLANALLGPLLPTFEAAGVLLLVALVAVVAIFGGERE